MYIDTSSKMAFVYLLLQAKQGFYFSIFSTSDLWLTDGHSSYPYQNKKCSILGSTFQTHKRLSKYQALYFFIFFHPPCLPPLPNNLLFVCIEFYIISIIIPQHFLFISWQPVQLTGIPG